MRPSEGRFLLILTRMTIEYLACLQKRRLSWVMRKKCGWYVSVFHEGCSMC